MKDDEKKFFRACYLYGRTDVFQKEFILPRTIVNILAGYIYHKRCWYYLQKWEDLGFYEYGTALDLGWFIPENLPERYLELIKEEK